MKIFSKQIISRYSERFKIFGNNIKTLGWGSREQQTKRFIEFKKQIENLNEISIVDFGCGFGDFYNFLGEESCKNYIGIDINKDLILEAKSNFKNIQNVEFICSDLFNKKVSKPIANIGIMVGVLNFNLKKSMDNFEFSKQMIENAFTYVDNKLIVDFISTTLSPKYPKEDFIYYHKPSEILDFCLTLTDNVSLFHNYDPIPQKEFLICLQK